MTSNKYNKTIDKIYKKGILNGKRHKNRKHGILINRRKTNSWNDTYIIPSILKIVKNIWFKYLPTGRFVNSNTTMISVNIKHGLKSFIHRRRLDAIANINLKLNYRMHGWARRMNTLQRIKGQNSTNWKSNN